MVLTPGLLDSLSAWFATNNPDNDTLTTEQASSSTTVLAFQGNDTITGSQNTDVIYGGQQNDELFGQAGGDSLFGNKDTDLLDGGLGDDVLFGGSGSDLIVGGEGVDILIGDRDVDFYKGGEGADIFVLRTDQAGETQEIDSFVSLFPGIPDEVELPDAIITDFDSVNDQIGLTEGLTRQDITFETFNSQENFGVTIDLILPIVLSTVPEGVEFLEKGGISSEDLDPDGDGVLTGTAIRIAENNQLLGYVLNVEPEVLGNLPSDRFVSSEGLF
ncbi:calcium-binding protein [Lyngbya sp. PCC 8106]|uniref:calcium-binding protein n=1 Tax=Lyngbya sp. (strain PCC 8106) TaxID=313612 RepID=UPI0000EAAB2F|nr:calcium-binding protein [Lyngbya sp. PCC 8106]EAW33462.1 putative secreted calcium-binding protein [Lyngbya sp. PCC 8106]